MEEKDDDEGNDETIWQYVSDNEGPTTLLVKILILCMNLRGIWKTLNMV